MNDMVSLHWLDWERADKEQRNKCGRKLGKNDIFKQGGLPKGDHVKKILREKYGERSSKIDDPKEHNFVIEAHERLRKRITKESSQLVKYIYTSLAKTVGIESSGGGKFSFVNICDDIVQKWDEVAFVRAFFVIRAAWDENPRWIILAEKLVMERLCLRYENDFVTEMNNFGCVASIISHEKVRKLRDFNVNLRAKCGRMIKVSKGVDKSLQNTSRRPRYIFSQKTMVEEYPEVIKKLDKKYQQAPQRNEIITEQEYNINVFNCSLIKSSSFHDAKRTFSLVDYHCFNPNANIKTEQDVVVEKEKEMDDDKEPTESLSDTKRGKRKKLTLSKKQAPKIYEEDTDSSFSQQTEEDIEELTFDCYPNIDTIFADTNNSLGEEFSECTVNSKQKSEVQKINSNTNALKEMEIFKKKLVEQQEDEKTY